MKDDFTRDTFDVTKHFSRVLMQQGRVTLDADHNEQTDILLHFIRTLAADIIGPYAAPTVGGGFHLVPKGTNDFTIAAGRFYVDGILVENDADCSYAAQPDYTLPAQDPLEAELLKPTGLGFWLYLDVWERNITWIEDNSIREVALNGPDTCARSRVVWQVKALSSTALDMDLSCAGPLTKLTGLSNATMAAQLDPGKQIADPCITTPSAQYRGTENQLYRVEIHTPGAAGTATCKWSRDNASVATTWLGTTGNDLQVGDTRGFEAGVWVELSDDTLDLQGLPGPLVQITKVGGGVLSVDPSTATSQTAWSKQLVNPKLRRWDQKSSDALQLVSGAVPLTEGTTSGPNWIDLEDGIQVSFSPDGSYRTGDYWLIPARVATGQIEWPSTPDASGTPVNDAIAPHGVEHHYAPLGILQWSNETFNINPCLCTFNPINNCFGNTNADTIAPGTRQVSTARKGKKK